MPWLWKSPLLLHWQQNYKSFGILFHFRGTLLIHRLVNVMGIEPQEPNQYFFVHWVGKGDCPLSQKESHESESLLECADFIFW